MENPKTSYGEIARLNGIKFEQEIFTLLSTNKNFINRIKNISNMENEEIDNISMISNKRVKSIINNKLTTSKADIIIYMKSNKYIPISIKMTNKGSQFQITTLNNLITYLECKNILVPNQIKIMFEKFLGIIKPSTDELIELDKKRKIKNCKRYWLNEFLEEEQECFIEFIKNIKIHLLQFCICDGMCQNLENRANIFIINTVSYTDTNIIKPIILNYDMLLEKIDIGIPKITKDGNLELNKYIGIQRKGSGKNELLRQGLQFKDRGYNYILEKMEENDLIDKFNHLILNDKEEETLILNDKEEEKLILNDKEEENKILGISLFACSGIAEYYLSNTNIEIICANELLKERCDIYKKVYPNTQIIEGDISIKKNEIIQTCIENNITFCIATPPCQSFSNAGKKQKNDKRTNLFLILIDIIKEVKFKYVLIENVPSFMTSSYIETTIETTIENTIETTKIIQDKFIEELGELYNMNTKILNTKDYEVPQSRKRSITLLTLKEYPPWTHPEKYTKIPITVRDVIEKLPSLPCLNIENPVMQKWHTLKKHNDNHIIWMSHTPTGKTAFKNEIYFPSINGRRIKGYNTTYKRIEWDQPAPTITMSSGSISSQNNVHPGNPYIKDGITMYDNPRVLSVYEIALLTGLDENWLSILIDNNEKIMREIIGEAIPPKLIYHLCKNLL